MPHSVTDVLPEDHRGPSSQFLCVQVDGRVSFESLEAVQYDATPLSRCERPVLPRYVSGSTWDIVRASNLCLNFARWSRWAFDDIW